MHWNYFRLKGAFVKVVGRVIFNSITLIPQVKKQDGSFYEE